MGLFGRRKSNPVKPQAEKAVPREQAKPLETTHPVFQLKAGMDKDAVIGLLGGDYLAMSARQLLGRDDPSKSIDQECWLYSSSPRGYDFEIVFRSGSLASATVKERNTDGARTLLARIDHDGLAAAEPYRTDLGARSL